MPLTTGHQSWAGNAAATMSGAGMNRYLQNNPQQLNQYWQQNPQALLESIKTNPTAFGYSENGAPPTGLIGSEQALNTGMMNANNTLAGGVNQATQTLNPYNQAGSGATDLMSALSGANGPEAQAAAYANYMESPGQKYLRDQGEQAITRNSAATGQLGGGNVLKELQQHGIGLAAQDFDNSYNRLGMLSSQGLNAASMLSGIQSNAASQGAGYQYGTGNTMAAGRNQAGRDIANAAGTTSSALADLVNQQGAGYSDQMGGTAGNLANILAGAGTDQSTSMQQLMTILANISVGQGSTVAGLTGVGNLVPESNSQESIGKLMQTFSTAIAGAG